MIAKDQIVLFRKSHKSSLLKLIRLLLGFTQRDVANYCGIDPSRICKQENGYEEIYPKDQDRLFSLYQLNEDSKKLVIDGDNRVLFYSADFDINHVLSLVISLSKISTP